MTSVEMEDLTGEPGLTAEEEVELHRRYRSGCRDSGERLARAIFPWAVQLTKRYRGRWDQNDRVSAVGMAVAKTLHYFDPARGRLTTFLATCMRTELQMLSRSRHRRLREREVAGDSDESVLPLLDESVLLMEIRDIYFRELAALTPRQRESVRLWLESGLSMVEIGRELGQSPTRVSFIWRNFLRSLRPVAGAATAVETREFLLDGISPETDLATEPNLQDQPATVVHAACMVPAIEKFLARGCPDAERQQLLEIVLTALRRRVSSG